MQRPGHAIFCPRWFDGITSMHPRTLHINFSFHVCCLTKRREASFVTSNGQSDVFPGFSHSLTFRSSSASSLKALPSPALERPPPPSLVALGLAIVCLYLFPEIFVQARSIGACPVTTGNIMATTQCATRNSNTAKTALHRSAHGCVERGAERRRREDRRQGEESSRLGFRLLFGDVPCWSHRKHG